MSPAHGSTDAPPTENAPNEKLGLPEFVALVAMLISLVALAIDAMLPALPLIGADLGVSNANDTQWVVSLMFLGLGVGQLFFGPLSDSIGRKNAIYAGIVLFIAGCIVSILAADFATLLVGRVLQGVGAASSRSVSLALVRDQYEGRSMARVMSFVMSVFILVPAVAPALGQAVLAFAPWRAIFGLLLVQALIAAVWFGWRQPETLLPAQRRPFSWRSAVSSAREVLGNRFSLGYTVVGGLVSGAFITYLISAQQIFVEQYDQGARFAAYFAGLALSIGVASIANSALVMRFGMERLTRLGLMGVCVLSFVFLGVVLKYSGTPPLWTLMLYMLPLFFCVGILFGNVNAMAMVPMGHIAGMAAALIGSLTTLISLFIGAGISQAYNGTMFPLVGGFCVMGASALGLMTWIERGASSREPMGRPS